MTTFYTILAACAALLVLLGLVGGIAEIIAERRNPQ